MDSIPLVDKTTKPLEHGNMLKDTLCFVTCETSKIMCSYTLVLEYRVYKTKYIDVWP